MLIELVVKQLTGASYIRPDETNNAKDDFPEVNRKG
jgi:hypothetical protein